MDKTSTQKTTVTSALPYANGPLHIGHIAGAYLPADFYVRYLRLRNREVLFICGSDEHGAAITLRAKREGISPRDIVDKYHEMNKESFERFGISFDYYDRTSDPLHHQTSQEFFTVLNDKGVFTEQETEQFYDEEYHQFLADRYVMGTCPNCDYEQAYGDQCENCGTTHNPTDLINPLSTLSGKTPILRRTRHWYLPLDRYQSWLESWLVEGKKGKWKNNVYGQCRSWLEAGLQARSMTRDLDWGVDVPLPGAEGKKLYVWLDAPIGYISATRRWALSNGTDWEPWWKLQENEEDNSRLIHFIGKDNIVFHCIIFPVLLHAHGGFLLPDDVPANEFLNLEGQKMSTSRNHAVWLHEYQEAFPGKEDELRYALGSILPENKDADFTWRDYQARVNNELVAILGNFVNRVIVLTQKYFEGKVPEPGDLSALQPETDAFGQITEALTRIEESIEHFRFREALAGFMNVARIGNKYLTDQEPWIKWKKDPESVKPILYTCLQIVANLGILSRIFLPQTALRIGELLQIGGDADDWDQLGRDDLVPAGHQLVGGKAPLLFEKVEDSLIEAQLEKLAAAALPESTVAAAKEEITFEDFQKMDIRIGTILEAEKMKKANKLLKFRVDTGLDTRTIVSGVAEFFTPEELIGKKVPVLVNLKPRKIRGVESQGMILFAEDPQAVLHLLSPVDDPDAGSAVN